jgi:sortase A
MTEKKFRKGAPTSWGPLIFVLLVFLTGFFFLLSGLYMPLKAKLAQHLMEDAWAHTLASGGKPTKPWGWADVWPVARLSIKNRGVDVFVLSGTSGEALAFGPGHMSELADLGEVGTAVVAGHRDSHFKPLKHVKGGDKIYLEDMKGKQHFYTITETKIMDYRKAVLPNDKDISHLVLVTCFPFDALKAGGPLRFVVLAIKEGTSQVSTQ